MDKRYQVFVSSTYQDLQDERQEIIQALLELDCIPSGMELFPAANEDQWSLIKKVIDDCDYYIVVIAGRYGSIGPAGISFTEMEYRYALEQKKPIIAFIHKDIGQLAANRVEKDALQQEKLIAFTELARQKMVRTWDNAANLGSVVSRSLVRLIKSNPAVGWVRADNLPDESAAKQILNLRNEIDRLKTEIEVQADEPPTSAKQLSQGEETVVVHIVVTGRDALFQSARAQFSPLLSWNNLFASTAPSMLDEANEETLKERIMHLAYKHELNNINSFLERSKLTYNGAHLIQESYDTYLVQMVSLGLIQKSTKQKSVKNTATFWKLTRYGEKLMYELRAIKRKGLSADDPI